MVAQSVSSRAIPYRIMVIDDSQVVRKIIEGILVRGGYLVDTFPNGSELMIAFTERRVAVPDLMLIDIKLMDAMDGYMVAKLFRRKPEFADTIMVMISSNDSLFDRMRGIGAGARRHIPKPFKPGEILETIHTLLQE